MQTLLKVHIAYEDTFIIGTDSMKIIGVFHLKDRIDELILHQKLKLLKYYAFKFFVNPKYFNSGLLDTIWAYHSYYFEPRNDYYLLFDYIDWDEKQIENTLINNFNWETSLETNSTWRIGDGTAPFYNYVYVIIAGFCENDTFRSNQVRNGLITREDAMYKMIDENKRTFAIKANKITIYQF